MKNNNPFKDFSISELEIAYICFTNIEDTEAVAMIEEVFCKKAILEWYPINFN